jgi:hypothetical protein
MSMFQAILPVVRPVAVAGVKIVGGLTLDAAKYAGSIAAGLVIAGCMVHGVNKAETALKALTTRLQLHQIRKTAIKERAMRKVLSANGFVHRDQMGSQLHAEIQRMIDNGRLALVPTPILEDHAA